VLAYDTYPVLEHLELQRLHKEGRVGTALQPQVALSQLFNRTDLDLPPLIKADGREGVEEASYLFKIIQPATQPDKEADGADKKKGSKEPATVKFFNDYGKMRKGHGKGGGGASEDDASSMSEMSTNLAGASAQHEVFSAPARRPSAAPTAGLEVLAAAAAGGRIKAEQQEGSRTNQGNVLATGGASLPPDAAAGKKRKKVIVVEKEEEEEEEEKDDDDMNIQQILPRVKAASPSTVPAPAAAAAIKKQQAAQKRDDGGGKGGRDDSYVITKKKPKLADGALDGGRGEGAGRGGGGGVGGSSRGEGKLAEAHPNTTATTANDGARAIRPSSLPSSSAAPRRVPAPAVAPAMSEAVSVRPPSSASSINELKQRLKVLKRPHATLAPADVPFFLQTWGQIMGKDRQRVLEALERSSDAVRAAFRSGGGLGGLVYWLHDQMSPRALGSQERKVLQGESEGVQGTSSGSAAEIFIQMLRLVQGLVEATANTGWDVEVGEWRASQAGPVLADVEERLVPHTLHRIGGEEGKREGGHGVWPHEAKVVATGVVHTIRAALAIAGRYPTPQERARLASHPPDKPLVMLPPAHVNGGATGSLHPARASQAEGITTAGSGAAFGALAAVTVSRRKAREGLHVSFKGDDELLQVHNYKSLEVAADEQARRRANSLLDVKTANDDLETGSTCFVS